MAGLQAGAGVMDQRLDPVLRAVATTRTDLSDVSTIGVLRDGLDARRSAAVAGIDATGVVDQRPGCLRDTGTRLPRRADTGAGRHLLPRRRVRARQPGHRPPSVR